MAIYEVARYNNSNGSAVISVDVDTTTDVVTRVLVRNQTGQSIRVYINSNEGWEHTRNVGANDSTEYSQNVPTAKQFNFSNYDWTISFDVNAFAQ